MFHNALDIAEIVRQLLEEGWEIDPEDLAHISPYLTEHINRFGEYSTRELGIQPEAYDPKLDVDFTQFRDQNLRAEGFGTAAGSAPSQKALCRTARPPPERRTAGAGCPRGPGPCPCATRLRPS
ncbi:Tn3 family transposase [Streptomyces acidiscabies]|uniref:Tn3 family transposase n=1 Tax=Streptomyces acidiscabies TaxID=42234 RepID=UPI0038F716FD